MFAHQSHRSLLQAGTWTFLILFLVIPGLVDARRAFRSFPTEVRSLNASLVLRTNAQRMANGFTPKKPRNLFDPSRTRVARDSAVSPVPYTGYIALRSPSNPTVLRGWVSKDISVSYSNRIKKNNQGVFDPSILLKGRVSLPVGSLSYGPLNLNIVAALLAEIFCGDNAYRIQDTPYNFGFLGIICSSIATSPPPFTCLISPTNPTPQGSSPAQVGNLPYSMSGNNPNSESMVWYFDTVTKRLGAKFIQPNGAPVDVYFGWNEGADRFLAFGYSTFPAPTAERVDLYLETTLPF